MRPCRTPPCIETLDASFNHHPHHAVAVVRCNRHVFYIRDFPPPLESLTTVKMQLLAVCFVEATTHASTSMHVYTCGLLSSNVFYYLLCCDTGYQATALSAVYMAANPWVFLYYERNGFNMCPRM